MCHKLIENYQQRLKNNNDNNNNNDDDDDDGIKFKSCVYYSNWSVYQRKHFPCNINLNYYTHIFYAFILIDENTGKLKFSDEWCDLNMPMEGLSGNIQLFNRLKESNRFKLIMSIGGWGTNHLFESIIQDGSKLDNFVDSCCYFIKKYGFDGVDIDWEYPKNNHQGMKFVQLLQKLRLKLGNNCILTIAAPASDENIQNLPLRELDQYLTFWNIMCYDFTGEGWSKNTGHQSNLFGNNGDNSLNSSDVISKYKQGGVDSEKLILGMPLYGRIFHGVNSNKIGQPFSKERLIGSIEAETIEYKNIPTYFETNFDAKKVGAIAYESQTKQFISFDNPQSVKIKAQFIKSNKLGGGMFWDSAGDKDGNDSLAYNFVNQLGGIEQLLDKT
ncbi:unnamed protein product [Candida verbasci]|uniref:chitinase n=1 Tax=Candida verbasci TaxID=1227364 RepID=A0A9W4TUG8_9ASCO|nr:unnamed protein product [Candida verbasci]